MVPLDVYTGQLAGRQQRLLLKRDERTVTLTKTTKTQGRRAPIDAGVDGEDFDDDRVFGGREEGEEMAGGGTRQGAPSDPTVRGDYKLPSPVYGSLVQQVPPPRRPLHAPRLFTSLCG